jgi:tRNA(Ile)-lysidine synthase
MALLDGLARVGPGLGLSIVAHGVDHGLRPEAGRELDLAEAFAAKLGIPFDRTCVTVPRGGNVQARARERRWEALATVARRHDAAIATAHHADDRAETVLMRLLRGAGARGLGVLPPRAHAPAPAATEKPCEVMVVRPLLRARREDILRHVTLHDIPFASDPSNVDPRYLRTAVRRDVLPLLAKLDPNVVRHLEAIADELADARAPTPVPPWASALPRATQEALVKLATSRAGAARVWLPGGLVVSVDPRARAKKSAGARARTRVVPVKPSG